MWGHYGDVIIRTMASQITSLTIVCSTVYSDTDQRKHQSSASNSPHKGPVTRKMFPFDDDIMYKYDCVLLLSLCCFVQYLIVLNRVLNYVSSASIVARRSRPMLPMTVTWDAPTPRTGPVYVPYVGRPLCKPTNSSSTWMSTQVTRI